MGFKEAVLLYKRYISGWGELGIMFVVYILFFLIPAYYTIITKIPPENEVNKTEGKLFYKKIPGSGYLVGLHTLNGDMFFNCKPPIIRGNGCSIPKNVKNDLEGKHAVVHWYNQKIYFMSHQNRLIQLDVNDKTIINRNSTTYMMKVARKLAIIFSTVGVFIVIALNATSRRILKDTPQ